MAVTAAETSRLAAYLLPVHMRGARDTWQLAHTGVSCPKLLRVVGSDGRTYTLVKGAQRTARTTNDK
jgi:hypothetical protein